MNLRQEKAASRKGVDARRRTALRPQQAAARGGSSPGRAVCLHFGAFFLGMVCYTKGDYGQAVFLVHNLGQFTRNYTQTTKRGLLTTNKG